MYVLNKNFRRLNLKKVLRTNCSHSFQHFQLPTTPNLREESMRAFLITYSWLLLLKMSKRQHALNFIDFIEIQFNLCITTLIYTNHMFYLCRVIVFLHTKYLLDRWMLILDLPCGSIAIFCKIEPISSSLTITFGEGTDTKFRFVTCFVDNPPTRKWKWS